MLIEIRKAGFVNKGAELMLYSVWMMIKEAFPNAEFVLAPTVKRGGAPYIKRAELGFLQKAWLWRYGVQWGELAALAPKDIREMFGVVLDREIDIVLDVAGFSYSDQCGAANIRELALSCRRWRKQGTKLILLPQAFGPFAKGKSREWMKIAVDNADLIFARDPISYQHLIEATGECPNVRMAPDFTNLIEGELPDHFDTDNMKFCIIPNYRMIDKTPREQSEAYIPFMMSCAQYLIKINAKPFILIHEGANDTMLAEQIRAGMESCIPIVHESHPLKIKGIIGKCDGVLGSRFHGLVSALSQGVPSLATGWSHKYKMLFQDYDFEEGLLDVMGSKKAMQEKIDLLNSQQASVRKKLMSRSVDLKYKSKFMWEQVFSVLNS